MSVTQATLLMAPEAHAETLTTSSNPENPQIQQDIQLSTINLRQNDLFEAHLPPPAGLPEEQGTPTNPISQGVPPELANLLSEVIFVLVCTAGQVIFSLTIGQVAVTQFVFREALGVLPAQTPWLIGSSALASGLSVIVFGPLADLAPPKPLMVGAFLWEAIWNGVTAAAVSPELKVLFFVARAMQGLAVGVLVSASMSILGRVYNPGIRKTRVFSMMAAGAPFGYWIGCVQGGLLSAHLPWIFGTTAMFLAVCAVAAYFTIPDLRPAADSSSAERPSVRQFDYTGALLASLGCGLVLFGLTQGSAVQWSAYTYVSVILGLLMLVAFYFVEKRVKRPLIPSGLWRTPGFVALLVSYVFGYGAFTGAWQFYAIQFWLRYQGASPLTAALYLLPNGIVGVLAAWVVSKTLHVVPGHWILAISMVCFGIGPVFFLPQTPSTPYWALSMPGVALATFGPDLSFAAAAVFITSSVPRSYQGAAGGLLVTVQNLTMAIFTSVAGSIGIKIEMLPDGEVGLQGIRAIWWFGFAFALLGALITITMVRIPKAEEKEHVQ
ncbi:MFS general substrate transporter [Trichoderma citrinoviride]|uniref:MFS general substrate transporter n=1 Tax=Trichoderma citrinoviride TaxID=58853 RepID=A0A2T4BFT1_9HYPO|nr:MFS general substrate transporter [Trichoderma citrinoviride]PTB68118.1 MFS general substrate transporter [Trichoderma citrinoviride]